MSCHEAAFRLVCDVFCVADDTLGLAATLAGAITFGLAATFTFLVLPLSTAIR